MKQILVCVFSETGNTMKIAETIRDEAASLGHAVKLAALNAFDPADLGNYDIAFVGSTCHSSSLAQPVLDLLAKLPEHKRLQIAGFVTHSTWGPSDNAHRQSIFERWAGNCQPAFESACARTRVGFLGFFGCMGAPNPGIETFIQNTIMPETAEWDEYIAEARQHPNEQDVLDARSFTREILVIQ
jgi:flavodoxin